VPKNKNYATITSKQGRPSSKKNPQKIEIRISVFFFLIDYVFVTMGSFDSFHLD